MLPRPNLQRVRMEGSHSRSRMDHHTADRIMGDRGIRMNPKDLFYTLLRAEDEMEVDLILQDEGYLVGDEAIWLSLGGYENNFATVGGQHEDPTGALVDKMINGIDAVLMAQCFSSGVSPESYTAPQTMIEAVERFFKIRGGKLGGIDATERTKLAENFNLRLIAVGSKESPCYLLTDSGEGQTPRMFHDTFLSLGKSNKLRTPFVQGKFNSGGTGVLQFCGTKNYQLISSRRHPYAPREEEDESAESWGFTLVRRLPPDKGRRNSMYVYLAPQGNVLTFDAKAIFVLPGNDSPNQPPRPYEHPLEYGTCIKLYNYRWPSRSTATTEARYAIERFLHGPCLPFRVTETRAYRANYYSTTISGVWARTDSNSVIEALVEEGFPATAELDIQDVGRLPYKIVVFSENINPRHVPHGVFFTFNGQVQGQFPQDFIRNRLKFDYLNRYLLVSIDCTQMEDLAREDLLMTSRDRLRRNETYHKIISQLEEELKRHPGLRALNAARRKKEIEKALESDSNSIETFQHLLSSDPSLAGLFTSGIQLITSTGPGPSPEFKGRRFPTYFRLSKEPRSGLTKYCPINRTIRVVFETDAENEYFDRINSPGSIEFDPPDVQQHWNLWNGQLSVKFGPMADAKIGDKGKVRVTVSDLENETRGGPFRCAFEMVIADPLDRPRPPKPPKPPKPCPGTDNKKTPQLTIPNIREVSKEEWANMDPQFSGLDSLRIRADGNGGYDFYLNVDNSFLLTELSRGKDIEKELMKYWFKYGLVFCGLGMLQQYITEGATNGHNQISEEYTAPAQDPVDLVNGAMFGLARVIIPVVRRLYKGPK